ncbi:MAG TPA: hypothetical protein VF765_09255 [Polyangiaceae bacterium]
MRLQRLAAAIALLTACGTSGSNGTTGGSTADAGDAGGTIPDATGPLGDGASDAPSSVPDGGARGDGGDGGKPLATHPVTSRFFGMHTNTYGNGIPFGTERLWDSGTAWSQIQTAAMTYDFSSVQSRVADAQKYGFDLLYTFGRTPPFLAATSTVKCDYGNDGQCNPPDDVATDGTGADAHVKAFWTAFMNAMCTGTAPNKTCGPLKYFEMWNEPNADQFWSGTYAQLARMSADATAVIKSQCASCTVLTPGVACGGDGYHANGDAGQCEVWMAAYLKAWQALGNLPDAGAWHPYPAHTNVSPSPFPETNVSSWDVCPGADAGGDMPSCTCKAGFVPNPECQHSVVDQITVLRDVFDANGLAGKPMIATEGSWNEEPNLPDPDQQAAWLARWYLVQAGAGIEASCWYAEDAPENNGGWGRLLTSADAGAAGPNAAGVAYQQVYGWLVGGAIGACSASGTLWSCPAVDAKGDAGVILWDTAQTCAGGHCSTRDVPVAASFTRVSDLAGSTSPVSGMVSVGAKPVFVR